MRLNSLCLLLAIVPSALFAQEPPPRSRDPRIKIELFAENPQIVTPTGIDVDHAGRVWAVESNTHFPPKDYKGHPTDRVLVMQDKDRDGRADEIIVFTDGLKHTMSVAVRPGWFGEGAKGGNGEKAKREGTNASAVYLATRREIRLFYDDDGDLKADRSEPIVHLDTKGDYPHNGLAGFAFHPLGWLYFGFGENLGADYKIIGSDGTTLSGGGEGGNVYRCRPDGSKLEFVATGFWNPHASCFDGFGRLFTVDNDPDSRPPCRLMHIIPGGDYGYRFRNGRKGLHPFTAWNGEIPGTLPMVAGTGEAPSGIVAYESDGLPEEYLGNLFVTSWGDHRIDRFRLKPQGASFTSLAEPLITGGENFRPVGIAAGPDGSLFCTDWVLRDYNLHGRGRVWRISGLDRKSAEPLDLTSVPSRSEAELRGLLNSPRLDVRRTAATALVQAHGARNAIGSSEKESKPVTRARFEAAMACVRLATDDPATKELDVEVEQVMNRAPNGLRSGRSRKALAVDALFGLYAALRTPDQLAPRFPLDDKALRRAIDDPFVYAAMIESLSATKVMREAVVRWTGSPAELSPTARLLLLLSARRQGAKVPEFIAYCLRDYSFSVRRAAVQWVAEEKMKDFRPQVEAVLNDPTITADLFLATIAALEMLDGVNPAEFDKTPPEKYVLPMVKDEKRPAAVRSLALRLVEPTDPAIDAGLLEKLIASNEPALRLEAIRTVQGNSMAQIVKPCVQIAADEKLDKNLRAEAVMALARSDASGNLPDESRTLLLKLLAGNDAALRSEALRSLRGFVEKDEEVKKAVEQLKQPSKGVKATFAEEIALALSPSSVGSRPPLAKSVLLDAKLGPGDESAGRRTFYHVNSAGCFKCHTVNGRGGKIGPDLSTIGRSLSREKLIDSILEPSKEIAPQFVAWSMETQAGKVRTGMIVHENEGKTILGDAEGKLTELKTIDIVERVPQKTSVMPEKLAERMTIQEFRDLLAFLESLK